MIIEIKFVPRAVVSPYWWMIANGKMLEKKVVLADIAEFMVQDCLVGLDDLKPVAAKSHAEFVIHEVNEKHIEKGADSFIYLQIK